MNKRHSENKNLTILNQTHFQGYNIYLGAPLAVEYLYSLSGTMHNALSENPRTMAFRFDLHLPNIANNFDAPTNFNSKLISRFVESFKAKLSACEQRKRNEGKRLYPCTVRYVWCKERADAEQAHYHFIMFLNNDAYNRIGSYTNGGDNIANRIIDAWASAISLDEKSAGSLVHFPKNPVYYLNSKSPQFPVVFSDAFYRFSYIAKLTTKHYGPGGGNAFGCSRV